MLGQAEAIKELVQLGQASKAAGVQAKVHAWVAQFDALVSLDGSFFVSGNHGITRPGCIVSATGLMRSMWTRSSGQPSSATEARTHCPRAVESQRCHETLPHLEVWILVLLDDLYPTER
jgi:hypothetical protein